MSDPSLNFKFIENVLKENRVAHVFLVNGVHLMGNILEQDEVSIIMTCSSKDSISKKQMVTKSAISTIFT